MKIYEVSYTQKLPTTLDKAWAYFTNPDNLEVLTPKDMGLRNKVSAKEILVHSDNSLYIGKLITHNIKLLPFLPFRMDWVSEITHLESKHYFVDQQVTGPYAYWHHTHIFREIPQGIEAIDVIRYALPLGVLGRMMQPVFIQPKLQEVFAFRHKILEAHFGKI